MKELRKRIEKAAEFIQKRVDFAPEIAIILGTGLGALAEKIEEREVLDYSHIPSFPVSTAPGHEGQLVMGTIADKRVTAMKGRFHYYEGYTLDQITFPVRVMKHLGAKILIVSNVAGGMNQQFARGDLVLITDHINFTGLNPLIGPNDDTLGPRFPDMSQPYDRKLIELTEEVAGEEKLKIHRGVYIGVTGPNLETAAEYRFFRLVGADMVGMSTVPEVIVALHSGLRVLGISCITDMCLPDALEPADFKEIIKAAEEAEPKLTGLILKTIEKIEL